MRILHLADLHYGPRHLAWIERAMTHAIDTAIAARCDLAILAGDSFDHALTVHEPAFAAFVHQVVRLAGHMPVVVLQGTHSHDRPGSLDVLKAIPSQHPIRVADQIDQIFIAGALVSTLPSLNRADPAMADAAPILAGFAARNQAARRAGTPTVLVTHGTVTGSVTESGFAMVAPDHCFGIDTLASAEADAVMLGHIHAHQSWSDVLTPSGARTTIAYPGSLARLVHGHMQPVGFLIWDVLPGSAAFTFHASPARQLLDITFDGPPDLAELRDLAKQVGPEDAVRIRFAIDEEQAHRIDKDAIRALFAAAETVKLEGRVLPVQRTRASGISQAVTLADKLDRWCDVTGSADVAKHLRDRLAMLQSQDPDVIAARLAGIEAEDAARLAA